MPNTPANNRRPWEDLSEFFDTGDFADEARLTISGKPRTVTGMLDNDYYGLPAGTLEVESSQPVFYLPTDQAGTAKEGDTLKLLGTTYTIQDVEPDGTGVSKLILRT